jgi:hypothetical protein
VAVSYEHVENTVMTLKKVAGSAIGCFTEGDVSLHYFLADCLLMLPVFL